AATDQLAVDEELRDRRPVGEGGELLADARVGKDVDGREGGAERLQGAGGPRREAAHRLLGRALHEEDHGVLVDRLLDGVAGAVRSRLAQGVSVLSGRAWISPPSSPSKAA